MLEVSGVNYGNLRRESKGHPSNACTLQWFAMDSCEVCSLTARQETTRTVILTHSSYYIHVKTSFVLGIRNTVAICF